MIHFIHEEAHRIQYGPSKGLEIWIRQLTPEWVAKSLREKLKWVVRDARGFAMAGSEAEKLYRGSSDVRKKVDKILKR